MRPPKTLTRTQVGIALITTLLLLLLMSAMVVGFMLLVTELLRRRIGHGKTHCGPGRALRHHLCPDWNAS